MKFILQSLFNLTFSSFIVSQFGGKKPENIQSQEDLRHKIIINAIKSAYGYHTHMKSLVLYIGKDEEHCVVFETELLKHDVHEPTTAIYWFKGTEISMVNLAWIDIWHLKNEYLNLMEDYQERIDYTPKIQVFLDQIAKSKESKV